MFGQEKYKMSLENLFVPDSKTILKNVGEQSSDKGDIKVASSQNKYCWRFITHRIK